MLDSIRSPYYVVSIRYPGGDWIDYGSKEMVDIEWMDMHVDRFNYYTSPNNLFIIAEHDCD